MIQYSEQDDSESLRKNTPIVNYRFSRKLNYWNHHTQLYISNSNLKIIVNCTNEFSNDIKEYSNSFSLNDLKNISRYYNFFNRIEDVLEDMASIFNLGYYDIESSNHKLNIILHMEINQDFLDIKLTLNKTTSKNNNHNKNAFQIIESIKDTNKKQKKILHYYPKKTEDTGGYLETKKSSRNKGVKSMNELNNLLTDLKDRLTVLEVTQNTTNKSPNFKNRNVETSNYGGQKYLNTGYSTLGEMNEKILLNMDSILKRIDKLEASNHIKDEKINLLKEKIRIYEPNATVTSDNESINDNNMFNFNKNQYNNGFNNMYQKNDYISLGTLKNKDTNTFTSNNSYMTNRQFDIKEEEEEEINNSFSNKKKAGKKKEKIYFNNDSKIYNKMNNKENKDNNINKTERIEEKEIPNMNNNSNIKTKNKHLHKLASVDNIRNQDDKKIYQNLIINEKQPKKKILSKSKSKMDINNNKNKKIEIVNTDLKKSKTNFINTNNYIDDSQRFINNIDNNYKINKGKSNLKKKKSNFINIQNNNKDNNDFNINNIDNNNINNSNDNNINNLNSSNPFRNSDNFEANNSENNQINNNFNYYNSINNKINKSNSNIINNEQINNYSNQMIQNSSYNMNNNNIQYEKMNSKYIKEQDQFTIDEEEKIKRQKRLNDESSSRNSSSKVKPKHKKLPIVQREDIQIYCKSHIIFTKDELRLLKKRLNNNKEKSVFFDVLYRATEDGDNVDAVKKIMNKEKRTLTLFYTEKGARFGIFVEKKLDTSILMTKYLDERNGTCFLVSLNNLEIYQIHKNFTSCENKLCFIKNKKKNKNGSSYAIYTPPKNFLGITCYMGDLQKQFNIENNEDIIGEKEEYKLKEVEVCKVSIEKKREQELSRLTSFVQKKSKDIKEKNSYGKEYSFQNEEDDKSENQDDNKDDDEKNKNNKHDKEYKEKIQNNIKYDYYDSGYIKGNDY